MRRVCSFTARAKPLAGLHIFLIAGEASGDKLGAALMAGLQALSPDIRFSGVGGPLMEARGLTSLFPMSELSVMGIAEVLPKLPKLLKRLRQAVNAVDQTRPDALVTIDSPDFCLRVAARSKALNPALRTIHYVAPTIWAWRPERAKKMAAHVDHVLALFPFEPPYMQAEGMGCDFVGHPVVAETWPDATAKRAFRQVHGIDAGQKLLLALPGSRLGEVKRMEPVFAEVARALASTDPDLALMIPASAAVADHLAGRLGHWPKNTILLDPRGKSADASEAQKRAAFGAADLALAASGTVSLELAAAGTPMVIAYKFNRLTTRIVKKKVTLKSATLVNILTDSFAIPEFLFEKCEAENITPFVARLLSHPEDLQSQIAAENQALDMLGRGGEDPGLRAARAVLAALQVKSTT